MTDEITPLPDDTDHVDANAEAPAATPFVPAPDDTMPLPLREPPAERPLEDEPAEEPVAEAQAERPIAEASVEEEPSGEAPAEDLLEQPAEPQPEPSVAAPLWQTQLEQPPLAMMLDAPLEGAAETSLEPVAEAPAEAPSEAPLEMPPAPPVETPLGQTPEPRSPYEALAEPVSPFFGDSLDEEPSAPLLDERTGHPLPPLPEELDNPLAPLPEADRPEKPAGPSSLGAVARVIVLPRSTFIRATAGSPSAWVAAVAIIALAAVTKGGVALGLAFRGAVPAGELASVLVRYGGALLGPIAFVFATAGILYAAQRWWQGDARFQVLLTAVSLSCVPLAIRDFGQAVYMVIRGRVLVHPGLSALVAPAGRSVLHRSAYALLGQIDAFTLWALVLLAVATIVTHGRGRLRRVLTALLVGGVLAIISAMPSFFIAPFLTR